jgi:hypothetical protein
LANSMSSALPTFLERWANSKLLSALLWSNCGPSANYRRYLVMGQLLFLQQCLFRMIPATRRLSAAFHSNGTWPIPCHRHYLPLLKDGPTRSYWQHCFVATVGHRQYLVMGQPHAIGSAALE